jgi:hypothetical protein
MRGAKEERGCACIGIRPPYFRTSRSLGGTGVESFFKSAEWHVDATPGLNFLTIWARRPPEPPYNEPRRSPRAGFLKTSDPVSFPQMMVFRLAYNVNRLKICLGFICTTYQYTSLNFGRNTRPRRFLKYLCGVTCAAHYTKTITGNRFLNSQSGTLPLCPV